MARRGRIIFGVVRAAAIVVLCAVAVVLLQRARNVNSRGIRDLVDAAKEATEDPAAELAWQVMVAHHLGTLPNSTSIENLDENILREKIAEVEAELKKIGDEQSKYSDKIGELKMAAMTENEEVKAAMKQLDEAWDQLKTRLKAVPELAEQWKQLEDLKAETEKLGERGQELNRAIKEECENARARGDTTAKNEKIEELVKERNEISRKVHESLPEQETVVARMTELEGKARNSDPECQRLDRDIQEKRCLFAQTRDSVPEIKELLQLYGGNEKKARELRRHKEVLEEISKYLKANRNSTAGKTGKTESTERAEG